jgi:SAM-dependent methyltransferase
VRIPRLPDRLHWDHNARYHPWLLRQLPARTDRILEIGCGTGQLAAHLSNRADRVDAVDLSMTMIGRARSRYPSLSNIRWLADDVLDPHLPLATGYDAVVAVASLHHLPLLPALTRMAALVRPGGVLAVVGLYRPVSALDHALGLLALPANAAVGVCRAAVGPAGRAEPDMPVRPPEAGLVEIRDAAGQLMPGSRLRRRLFWRYTLLWRRA